MKEYAKKPHCAYCKKEIDLVDFDKKLLPFCSKKCKVIDLGQWLGEKYFIKDDSPESAPLAGQNNDNEDD